MELHNVHVSHGRVARARLQPLSRFSSLQKLTLRRVFGSRKDPTMTVVMRQLPTSLRVSQHTRADPTTSPSVWPSLYENGDLVSRWPGAMRAFEKLSCLQLCVSMVVSSDGVTNFWCWN